jgi:excisionase family DNA binding protein
LRHKIALTALNLMTTHDVAKKLGVTIRSVQLWVEQGLLEGWKTPGGHRRITSESFNRFVLSQEINLEPTEFINTQLRVVAVEDNEAMLKLYNHTIESWQLPIKLDCFNNAYEALINITQSIPDALIIDLNMPGMDGFAMLEALEKSNILNKLAIIVISCLSNEEILSRGGLPARARIYNKDKIRFGEMKEFMRGLLDNKKSLQTN